MSSPAPVNKPTTPTPVDAKLSTNSPTLSTTTTNKSPPPPPPVNVSKSAHTRNMQNKISGKMI